MVFISSTNITILLEAEIVHRLVHNFLYPLPVAPPLYKLVDVLSSNVSTRLVERKTGLAHCDKEQQTHLRAIRTAVPRDIAHDLREVFRILNDVHVAQHLQVCKIRCKRRDLREGCNVVSGVISGL